MLIKFFIVLSLFTSLAFAKEETLKPLTTDYCTNYPEGTPKQPDLWKHCCLLHDMTFWAGGMSSERMQADLDLRSCIEETGARDQAKLIYFAVRIASYSPIKYPSKKWNNAWKNRMSYQELSAQDIDQLEAELQSGYSFIEPSLKESFIHMLRAR